MLLPSGSGLLPRVPVVGAIARGGSCALAHLACALKCFQLANLCLWEGDGERVTPASRDGHL